MTQAQTQLMYDLLNEHQFCVSFEDPNGKWYSACPECGGAQPVIVGQAGGHTETCAIASILKVHG